MMIRKNVSRSISKTTPPRLHRVLERPRLFERLESALEAKLLLILGQAAQGKSVLAASYLEWSGRPYAWLNLDPEDSDPVNLFLGLIQAVQKTAGHVDFTHLTNLAGISFGPRAPIPLYREWAVSFYELIPAGLQIGLDGLDNLSADAPSFLLLQVLMEETPSNVRLLMMSRSMPPLEIERWQMIHEAVVVNNAELAFTPEEAEALLREIQGFPITAKQSAVIRRLTEGWAGGLILTGEALSRSEDAFNRVLETGLGHNVLGRKVFQYFSEQVFSSLSASMQDFLLRTSVFDVVESSIIVDYIDREDSEQIIEGLSRRNLFVSFHHTSGKGRLFRYHQLFLDFLRTKFETAFTLADRKELLLKAARLIEDQGDEENALRYYFEAKEYQRAATVLERIGLDVLREGREGDIGRWLDALPPESIGASPRLLTYQCISRRSLADPGNLTAFSKAIDLYQDGNDDRGLLLALAYYIDNMMSLFLFDRDIYERAEDLLSSTDKTAYPYERSLLQQKLGFVYSLRGNIRQGLWAYKDAYVRAKQIDDPGLQAHALYHSILPLTLSGEFQTIEDMIPRIERLLNRLKSNEHWLFYRINYSVYLLMSGQLESAKELNRRALEDSEKEGFVYFLPFIMLNSLLCSALTADETAAERFYQRIQSLFPKHEITFLGTVALFHMGQLMYRKKKYYQAADLIVRAIDVFSALPGRPESHRQVARIVKALLDYHLNDPPLWEDELEEAREYFSQNQSNLYLAQYHLAKALLSWKKKDRAQTIFHLGAGIRGAEKYSYDYFFAVSSQDTVTACALALELQVEPVLDYAARLLSGRYAESAAAELDRLSRHRKPAVREKARETLFTIHLNNRPRLRIETLGGFRVRRGQTVVAEDDWGGSRPKLLLMAIAAHGCRGAPKEIIVDSLWPETTPAAGEKNFKFVLHRLRKVLEPDMDRRFGSSYVHLKNNMISLSDLVESIDLDDFLSLAGQGEDNERQGDIPGALAHYKQALSFYGGELFPEGPCQSWLAEKREEVKIRYSRILFRTARLHEERGALKKAISAYQKLIETEPTLEEAYCRLMTLHHGLGRLNEVRKVYRLCQRKLKEILDAEPEPVTVSLFERLGEGI